MTKKHKVVAMLQIECTDIMRDKTNTFKEAIDSVL